MYKKLNININLLNGEFILKMDIAFAIDKLLAPYYNTNGNIVS